ncbi:MAG: nucleotidyltransferase family protein [Armatimonadota bacterium]|nr:nucleotidyltransferase family protein [bacterium]MCS7310074.1 nucleotidyltransferase family protein [Armatimonadota bacterium]MDW8104241.1 nucleotidyltransferase family protein [Armatimonadota bacterium]MDW8290138.1 nucleotidyltransferase family protein [Armatimonadota bacterium]
MQVVAVVLAAGASTRMGSPKMLLPFGDKTIIETVLDHVTASQVSHTVVVLGYGWTKIYNLIEHLPVEVIVNPRPEQGMISSVQWAIAQMNQSADGILIVLGDQPLIPTWVHDTLIDAFTYRPDRIIVPTYEGKRGHPVLFSARFREEILNLPTDRGLNTLLHTHPEAVHEVPVDTDTILLQVNTPEEYQQILERARQA